VPFETEALFSEAAICPTSTVKDWGTTVVVAPHPDDESLGCGGAIAALRSINTPVYVLFVSDGTMSHPRSVKFPPAARASLREQEAIAALCHLGVEAQNAAFLRLPDTLVPGKESTQFQREVQRISDYLNEIRPQTILVPWRRDPHCDHRATWQLCSEALRTYQSRIQWREYPIWLWELARVSDLPLVEEGKLWRLDITPVLPEKKKAIAAHVSQTTRLIDDDPEGFMLTTNVLAHFTQPFEVYFDPYHHVTL
jgi:LmbE family N-acetylglucosaminyl deacetylase